ncbi:MAG TPA: HAD-IIIA family hydrolase [Candidatus Thermoplasmatota archaeon]|nr:HAD-IIIA family hydrolase [Candidatus Thermoplasmatota archaeon]
MTDGAVFLDRDGVLNEDVFPTPLRWSQVRFLPGALAAVARLTRAGLRVFVVTNKTAMGWKVLSPARNDEINRGILAAIEEAGGRVTKLYFCGHHPWAGCECRKPKPGMLVAAQREFGVEPGASWMVGDNLTDVLAGRAFGARTALVYGSEARRRRLARGIARARPDLVAPDLSSAVDRILADGKVLAPGRDASPP